MRHPRPFLWSIVPVAVVFASLTAALKAQTNYENYTFLTFAGPKESPGLSDGTNSAARFSNPRAVAVDTAGNIYVADTFNHTIRKITPAGEVTTMAGLAGRFDKTDETGYLARFSGPCGLAADTNGNIYVADTYNHAIRKVTPAGVVTTIAGSPGQIGRNDGTGAGARFFYPSGVGLDATGNVYVADAGNHTIRKITPAGVVSTFAGAAGVSGGADGTGVAAKFNNPCGLVVDATGTLYVADTYNHTIRKITPLKVVTTLAGVALASGTNDGVMTAARFYMPFGVTLDTNGIVVVADTYNHTIRRITLAGEVTTVAGTAGASGIAEGSGSSARFNYLTGIAADRGGNVYIADYSNIKIRKMDAANNVTTLAGKEGGSGTVDGNGTAARFRSPGGVAVDSQTNVYVVDIGTDIIRKIGPDGDVTTLAGSPGLVGTNNGTGSEARFNNAIAVAVDSAGNVFVADTYNHTIRKITPAGMVSNFAGASTTGTNDGVGAAARFNSPWGVAVDTNGVVYVADTFNHKIRMITPDGTVSTVAGSGSDGHVDDVGTAAVFSYPSGIAVDVLGNLYVTDRGSYTVRKIAPGGVVTTLAGLAYQAGIADGPKDSARFYLVFGIAVDLAGNVFVTESADALSGLGSQTIRKITPAGVVTTVGGIPREPGNADGTGPGAQLYSPEGVAVGPDGALYVGDTFNNIVRRGTPGPTDQPVVDMPVGRPGVTRHLDVTNLTTISWLWSFVRYPANSSAQLSSITARNPSFTPDVKDLYVLRFEGRDASGRVAIGTVSVLTEETAPTIKITSPKNGQRWSNAVFTVTGTASDNVGIGQVWCQVNEGAWVDAVVTTTNWSVPMALSPGTNIVRAFAMDLAGNVSSTNSVGFIYFAAAPLTVTVNGVGTITPNYNGKLLEIDKTYTMTAVAGAGFAFNGWSGSAVTNSPTLSFVMQSNLNFTANFRDIVKPTLAVQFPLNGSRVLTNSGLVTVRGTASDRMLAGVFYQFNGGDWTDASTGNNWTNWTVTVAMQVGTNVVRTFAQDQDGNRSLTNTVSFQYVVTSPVALQYVGKGTVTGLTNGQQLELERAYTFNATASTGFILTNWTVAVDSIPVKSTNRVPINFVMKSNLALTVTLTDVQRPGLTIQFPINGARVLTNNGLVTVRGITTDNWSVTNVFYQLNGAEWTNASTGNNWTNWTAPVAMQVGTNVVRVFAQDRGGNRSVTNSVSFQYVVTTPVTLEYVGKGTVTGLTNGQQLELKRAYTFNATPAVGFVFTNWTVEVEGLPVISTNRLPIRLTMETNLTLRVTWIDKQKPVLTITSPLNGARITNDQATVRGKVTDNGWVETVSWRLNGGGWANALGTTNWQTDLTLQPGTNLFEVYAIDRDGLRSTTNRAAYFRVVTNQLIVAKVGAGTITPDLNGKWLEIGRSYSMTATPALRNLFANWSESDNFLASNTVLRFMMTSNLTLRANFVTNPFVLLKGSYYGLFAETNEVRNHDRSGSFTLTLAEAGTYSASFRVGGVTLPTTGKFDWLGQGLLQLKPSLTSTVMITLRLDVTNYSASVVGVVSNALWQSPLMGYRSTVYAGTNVSPQKGNYTLIIPGNDDAAVSPGGDGYATVVVSPTGSATISGKLGDGTLLNPLAIPVSRDGQWALAALLYSGKGSVQGWMTFTNEIESDINGTLSWIKPASVTTYYPLGFTNVSDAVGSRYVSPGTNRVLHLTNGVVTFTGGNLPQAITNQVLLMPNNQVLNLSSNKLTLTVTLTTGLVTGSVTDTNTGKTSLFNGALLQKHNTGHGQFLGTNQSGGVFLYGTPP